MTITIQLTGDAASKVVFEHEKPKTALPAGVAGQTIICACIDAGGNIKDKVRVMEASGSQQLDAEAVEIGTSLVYPTGRPGCLRNAVNFKSPG